MRRALFCILIETYRCTRNKNKKKSHLKRLNNNLRIAKRCNDNTTHSSPTITSSESRRDVTVTTQFDTGEELPLFARRTLDVSFAIQRCDIPRAR